MFNKVVELNLEYGMPTVESAIKTLKNALTTYKGQGYKAVIVIHGYGSSGVGGGIKAAVKKCLNDSSMKGIVRAHAGGEQWMDRKKAMLAVCKSLEGYNHRIANNQGVSVVLLR